MAPQKNLFGILCTIKGEVRRAKFLVDKESGTLTLDNIHQYMKKKSAPEIIYKFTNTELKQCTTIFGFKDGKKGTENKTSCFAENGTTYYGDIVIVNSPIDADYTQPISIELDAFEAISSHINNVSHAAIAAALKKKSGTTSNSQKKKKIEVIAAEVAVVATDTLVEVKQEHTPEETTKNIVDEIIEEEEEEEEEIVDDDNEEDVVLAEDEEEEEDNSTDISDDESDEEDIIVDDEDGTGSVVEEKKKVKKPTAAKKKKPSAVVQTGIQKQYALFQKENFKELNTEETEELCAERAQTIRRFTFLETQDGFTAQQIRELESGLYQYICRDAEKRHVICHWDNTLFKQLYDERQRTIWGHLHHSSPRFNARLHARLKDGEFTTFELGQMTDYELQPENWLKLMNDQLEREQNILEGNKGSTTDMYKCGRCKKRECSYYMLQTRSADEPMTIFLTCHNCSNRWRQ
jgi:hypothetical protein